MKRDDHTHLNYLTIDVEDYFQVSAFEKNVCADHWDSYESRVVNNSRQVLEILGNFGVKATFFVLGWIAKHYPSLIKEIHNSGHEIACHSYLHRRITNLTPEEFFTDTKRAKELLEDITGSPVTGYRAPSFSITKKSIWALEILEELGFQYDSSIFPVYHDAYGIPDAPRFQHKLPQADMIEFPPSTHPLFGKNIPVAGGGYFRLFPYWLTKKALARINRVERQPFVFYLHPWEIDPGQPRFEDASLLSRFRHYNNLERTRARFEQLLSDFQFQPMRSGLDYFS